MGITITTEVGMPLRFPRALLRYLGLLVCTMLLGLGSLLLLFSRKKQMLQDSMANTVVVKKQPPSSAAKDEEAELLPPGK